MIDPDEQRWVLLEPPTAVSRFWRRALALAAPALVTAFIAFPPEVVAQRSTVQWVVQGVAVLAALVGACWVWITAGMPREITGEVNRILAWRPSRQYRRLERALRRGEPITGTDRALAAAHVASQQTHLHQPGGIQLSTAVMLTALADNHTGLWPWAIAAVALAANLSLVLVAHRARRLWEAASRAGVAPQVADTPPPSPRIPGSRRSPQR